MIPIMLTKKNKFSIKILILVAITAICILIPMSGDFVYDTNAEGVWIDKSGSYYILQEDYSLKLPGQPLKTGISWNIKDDQLSLRSAIIPGTESIESFTILKHSKNKLYLLAEDGTKVEFSRTKDTINHVQGNFIYRERIALPEKVWLSIHLYDEEKLISVTVREMDGQTPLPFEVYIPSKKIKSVKLVASISYNYDTLFTTARPVNIDLNKNEPLEILLIRPSKQNQLPANFNTPIHFQTPEKDLSIFFGNESDAFILGQNIEEFTRWKLTSPHNIELTLNNKAVVPIAILPGPTLILPAGILNNTEILLTSIDSEIPSTTFPIRGVYREEKGQGIITDCASRIELLVQPATAEAFELHQTFLDLHIPFALVSINVHLDASTSEEESFVLTPESLHSMESSLICPQEALKYTYWELVSMQEQDAQVYSGQTPTHIFLQSHTQEFIEENTSDIMNSTDIDTALLNGGQISGSDGCNNFFAQYSLKDTSISMGSMASTRMFCPEGMDQSQVFLKSLQEVDNWQLNESFLELRQGEKTLLLFHNPLQQTYWKLDSIAEKDAVSYQDQTEAHVILQKHSLESLPPEMSTSILNGGQISGSDGCNRFSGLYERDENSIKFNPMATTLMMCPDGNEQASAMHIAFQNADTWRIRNSALEFLQGEVVLISFIIPPAETLKDSYWKLISLGDADSQTTVQVFDNLPEPYLVLQDTQNSDEPAANNSDEVGNSEDTARLAKGQFNGSDGCNKFFGTFSQGLQSSQDMQLISFQDMGSTLMMCQEADPQATIYREALLNTDNWQIVDSILELRQGSEVLARFKENPLN